MQFDNQLPYHPPTLFYSIGDAQDCDVLHNVTRDNEVFLVDTHSKICFQCVRNGEIVDSGTMWYVDRHDSSRIVVQDASRADIQKINEVLIFVNAMDIIKDGISGGAIVTCTTQGHSIAINVRSLGKALINSLLRPPFLLICGVSYQIS